MKLWEISLFITVVTTFYIHIKNQMPMIQARRRMVKAVRKKGGDSVVWGLGWDVTMLNDPNFILKDSDDQEVHALKIDFINKWKEMMRGHRFTCFWAICAGATTAVILLLEGMFQH